jgi:DNA repair ATPase RecN
VEVLILLAAFVTVLAFILAIYKSIRDQTREHREMLAEARKELRDEVRELSQLHVDAALGIRFRELQEIHQQTTSALEQLAGLETSLTERYESVQQIEQQLKQVSERTDTLLRRTEPSAMTEVVSRQMFEDLRLRIRPITP